MDLTSTEVSIVVLFFLFATFSKTSKPFQDTSGCAVGILLMVCDTESLY